MAIEVIRWMMLAVQNPEIVRVSVRVNDEVAGYLNNKKRRDISALEEEGKMHIQVYGIENSFPEHLVIACTDERGNEVKLPI
jgi:ribonuclease E